jgi:tetratricopeptide (TPR) repeat protein
MGKTDLALTVVHSRPVQDIFPNYRFWVPCVKATSADLLRRILYIQLSITAESYDSLDALINELTASQERRLLLLDNFETPWDTAEQAQVHDIISRLAALPHISLLVTMTSKLPPTKEVEWQNYKLDSLDAAAAREVFNRLYPEAADAPKVKELLDAVDRIPLAITLMAADAQESQTSPEHLLQEWGSMGGPMIADMDQTIGRSVNRRVIKSNPEALLLLAILSMLPAGTTGDNLRWWAPSVTSPSSAVSTLHKTALIEQGRGTFESSRIFARPTIQSYMARHADVTSDVKRQVHEACYAFVLAHNSIPDDAKFKVDLAALGNEETNIEGLLMKIDASNLYPNALDALIAFSRHRSRTKLSTVVALHALEVTRIVVDGSDAANRDSATRYVADAHHSLGKILFKLEHYKDACQHFEQARCYFKSLSIGSDCLSAGKCSMDLAFTWMYMIGGFNKADLEPLVLDAKADLSQDPSDKLHIAHGMFGHSFYLWWMTQTTEAIEMIHPAKEIFEELECPASTAACLWLMARSHARLDEYPTALALAKQGLAIANDVGDDDLLSRLLLITARYLTVLSCHDEVFSLLEQALAQNQALGRPLAIAQNLELFGYNYTAKMDLDAAKVSYKGALAQYSFKTGAADIGGDGAETGRERCSYNLQKLDAMKEDAEIFSKFRKPILF